jgi:hypothetical protein
VTPGAGDDAPPPPKGDTPPVKIGTIRNFEALSADLKAAIANGALLALGGAGLHGENAVEVGVLSEILIHFDRLFRIMRASVGRLEVKRTGRLPEVAGARRLVVLPAVAGSYAIPLRLEDPEGEFVVEDRHELEGVVSLLGQSEEESFTTRLLDLPERAGDELNSLLEALAAGKVDLTVEVVHDGKATEPTRIEAVTARRLSAWLTEPVTSEVGVEILAGKLFRIDTKRGRVAVDVAQEDDEGPVVAEASFQPEQLDELRAALNYRVELEVSVVEERRRYERTARGRTMSVGTIRRLMPADA